MPITRLLHYIALIILFGASICGIYRYRRLDKAAKIFSVFICLACIAETTSLIAARVWHNSMPVIAIYSLIEFAMISVYFNYSIDAFRKKNLGIYFAIGGIVLGILDILFLQPLNVFNSYYLFFEGIGIISMSLFSFFRLLLKEEYLVLYKYPHFWFAAILSFFWSVTFLNWGLRDYIYIHHAQSSKMLDVGIYIINILFYAMFACVFILYPKMKTENA